MAGSPNSNLRGFNHAVQTLLKQPSQFLPHLTIPTFTHLPENLGPHLVNTSRPSQTSEKHQRIPTIRALVLDKDNTLCPPKTTTFPPKSSPNSPNSIPVFRLAAGTEKKPFCGDQVVQWFREREVISSPNEIAVVGDRLGTDVIMAGLMGSWSVWCKEGVYEVGEEGKADRNILEKMEVWIEKYLRERRGLKAPVPTGWE
ncbi:hypothetical protein N7490_000116 [Penicillium lividum]|nr:hypothetical protein N7490_000116 [Penicillium lividum]